MKNILRNNTHWFFITPALLVLLAFSIFPVLVAIVVSFTDMNLRGLINLNEVQFIGFGNYIDLLSNTQFIQAFWNTVFYVSLGIPLVIITSLGVALLLDYGKNKIFVFARALFYVPSVTTSVAVAVVWSFLLHSHHGLFNQALVAINIEPIAWLAEPVTARLSLVLMAAWRAMGLNMIIFLAALQGIPKDYYEAADIDGAKNWQKLLYIKVPLLRFATFFVATTTLIGWFQFFEEPMIMTNGGPLGGTRSIALFVYETGFGISRFGAAAAGSVVLFLIILTVTLVQFKLRKKDNGIY